MSVFDIFFKIGVNSTPLQSGLRDARKQFQKFGDDVSNDFKATIGGLFTYGSIKTLVFDTVAWGDKIGDLAGQFKLTTTEVQRIMRVTREGGIEFESFAKILDRVAKARRDAVEGGEGGERARGVFGKFGLDLSQLNDASVTDLSIVDRIGSAMREIVMTSRERVELEEIVGIKGGQTLDSIQKLHELGPIDVISEEQVDRMSRLVDNFQLLGDVTKIGISKLYSDISDAIDFDVLKAQNLYLWLTGQADYETNEQIREEMNSHKPEKRTATGKMYDLNSKVVPPKPDRTRPDATSFGRLAARDPGFMGASADELTRVGMFVGAGAGGRLNLVDIASAQLEVQQESERHLKKLSDKTEGAAAYSYPP